MKRNDYLFYGVLSNILAITTVFGAYLFDYGKFETIAIYTVAAGFLILSMYSFFMWLRG